MILEGRREQAIGHQALNGARNSFSSLHEMRRDTIELQEATERLDLKIAERNAQLELLPLEKKLVDAEARLRNAVIIREGDTPKKSSVQTNLACIRKIARIFTGLVACALVPVFIVLSSMTNKPPYAPLPATLATIGLCLNADTMTAFATLSSPALFSISTNLGLAVVVSSLACSILSRL